MKMSAFLAPTLLEERGGGGGGGGRGVEDGGMNPKLINKLSLGEESCMRNNYLEGFYHTVPSPLCKYTYLPVVIIVILRFSMHVIAALI